MKTWMKVEMRERGECKRLCEKPQQFWVIDQNISGQDMKNSHHLLSSGGFVAVVYGSCE